MKLSRILIRIIIFILDIIVKVFKIKIRVYNSDNIPEDMPVMFVANHFTRIETVFIPYILYKHNKKLSVSLAHYSFFGGWFGKFMEMVGALSTKHKDRDRILVGSLIKDTNYSIIFPEGQMIKDKKVLDGDEIKIYNDGKRRKPHTGSGMIALKSQLFRDKIKYLKETDNNVKLTEYQKHFKIRDKNIDKIINKKTVIVPMNITFFPLRPKENKLKDFIMKKVGKLSPRFEEEIIVESSLLTQGVDMCVNFGEPIYITNYLKDTKEYVESDDLYLSKYSREKLGFLNDKSKELMQDYMDSIYKLTTVTPDHIFAYYLQLYNKIEIDEDSLKEECYNTLVKVKKQGKANLHKKLKYIDTSYDDFTKLYESFMVSMEGIIERKNGYVYYSESENTYDFHEIRKHKIIEVLSNEIEYLFKFLGVK